MTKKNIVIVGGGTAGWLSALFAQKRFPDENVVVIESTKIGILGAGEGTVPMLVNLFNYLDITLEDLVTNTKSTIKNGIKFTNWSQDGGSYMHAFNFWPHNMDGLNRIEFDDPGFPNTRVFSYANDIPEEDFCFMTMVSNENRVPFETVGDYQKQYGAYAFHWDAPLLAKFLKEKALSRNVSHIDSRVVDADVNGVNIKSITLEDGSIISTDFVVDATGFARYFIGGKLGGEWISYSESLPANAAQAFLMPLDNEKELEPYTESIATDYGWIWKIPLQHRYGCGYVYDSRIISNEAVRKEITEKYGGVTFVKEFSFDPGIFKNVWIGNCMAIGLAAGFVEPLEATSLQQTAGALNRVFNTEVETFNPGEYRETINQKCFDESESIKDFIYLHYMTNKTNTDFWENFTTKNKMPDRIKHVHDLILNLGEVEDRENMWTIWPEYSYYAIAYGNGIMDIDKIKSFSEKHHNKFSKEIKENNSIKKSIYHKTLKHYDFLKLNGGFSE
jgi:tryptophan halogenase